MANSHVVIWRVVLLLKLHQSLLWSAYDTNLFIAGSWSYFVWDYHGVILFIFEKHVSTLFRRLKIWPWSENFSPPWERIWTIKTTTSQFGFSSFLLHTSLSLLCIWSVSQHSLMSLQIACLDSYPGLRVLCRVATSFPSTDRHELHPVTSLIAIISASKKVFV